MAICYAGFSPCGCSFAGGLRSAVKRSHAEAPCSGRSKPSRLRPTVARTTPAETRGRMGCSNEHPGARLSGRGGPGRTLALKYALRPPVDVPAPSPFSATACIGAQGSGLVGTRRSKTCCERSSLPAPLSGKGDEPSTIARSFWCYSRPQMRSGVSSSHRPAARNSEGGNVAEETRKPRHLCLGC